MNIAVLGAGAGGTTLAFDYAAHGHEVSLFDFRLPAVPRQHRGNC